MSATISALGFFFLAFGTYLFYEIVWRLYFSPISRFPGPRIAAITLLYELWYELVKGGQYTFKIAELHEKYGPIIRINPWEIHINDPDYYDEIYAGAGKKRDKTWYQSIQFGNPDAVLTTIPHDLHRIRRAPIHKFFSKASVTKLEPQIQSTIDKLCARLKAIQAEKKPLTMSQAWYCVTMDIITEYSFGESEDYTSNAPDFHTTLEDAFDGTARAGTVIKQVPWILPLMEKLPRSIVKVLNPQILGLLDIQEASQPSSKSMEAQVTAIKNSLDLGPKSTSYPTIFHEILSTDDLPESEKMVHRVKQEGQVIIAAGGETTAYALSVITYHVLSNQEIYTKLKEELKPVFENTEGRPKAKDLEHLPYLNAVISEGLRLSYGSSTHLQRVAPDQELRYGDWVIPRGTPVSMTSVLLHHNETIFPSSRTFSPDRWLENPRLSKYLVSFSRGSRACLGINLAWVELYLCVSYVFTQFPDMQLWDTTIKEVELVADYFLPKTNGKGVKVKLN
ncbi:hypothetical protein EG329_012633 [Mollisiaceae sp. DMI_Dod_QoI]|nr:hypothetical protein EG329_012633 [Helotiales sp. DMI_Dod_QoI]